MKYINNTKILLSALVLAGITLTSCQTTKAIKTGSFATEDPQYTDSVTTQYGEIRGTYSTDGMVEIYAGVPYAAPPVGDLRWKEPQDPEKWEGVKDTVTFAPVCMQSRNSPFIQYLYNSIGRHDPDGDREDKAPMSEDCLYLNIWKPAEQQDKLPVLVYVHGGSLMGGSSIFEGYDGESNARQGIIQVNIAYRCGVFGYMALDELAQESPNGTTGNYGLLDQIKALKWVHDNIAQFGGDPDNITIAGESAGSSSISALCCSPLTEGLFRRAIGESSSVVVNVPPHTFRSMDKALETGNNIKREFKADSLEELRNIPATKLLKTKYRNDSMTVDGYALTEYPWDTYQKKANHEEALLNGFNKEEAYAFTVFLKVNKRNYRDRINAVMGEFTDEVCELYPATAGRSPKDQYNHVFTARTFAYEHYTWSKAACANGIPVWEYYFTKNNGGIGSYHSGEIPYAYGNIPRKNKNYNYTDYQTEYLMQSYWLNFIKTGNPNGGDLPKWQQYDPGKANVLEIGTDAHMREDPYILLYKVFDKEQNKLNR